VCSCQLARSTPLCGFLFFASCVTFSSFSVSRAFAPPYENLFPFPYTGESLLSLLFTRAPSLVRTFFNHSGLVFPAPASPVPSVLHFSLISSGLRRVTFLEVGPRFQPYRLGFFSVRQGSPPPLSRSSSKCTILSGSLCLVFFFADSNQ